MSRSISAALVLAAGAACSTGADLVLNPDSGTLSVNGAAFLAEVEFNGVTIRADAVSQSVRRYLVLGDFVLNAGDTLEAVGGSNRGVEILVGNDAIISAGAAIDVSAVGRTGRASSDAALSCKPAEFLSWTLALSC